MPAPSSDRRPSLLDRFAMLIAGQLTQRSSGYEPYTPSDPESLQAALQPGDVLLVEGNQKVSAAIKYLTQSTWSHAALFVGDALDGVEDEHIQADIWSDAGNALARLIEVNLGEGCVAVPLEKYASFNTRICRPHALTIADRDAVVDFMMAGLGKDYDTRNIVDLARYLLPTPPVPTRWRRKMIALGSGEPSRAICSTLIAQAFQSVRYPILPTVERLEDCLDHGCEAYAVAEVLHIRHHSLFTPRDFDLSPYFGVVKPTIEAGFDYRDLNWDEAGAAT